MFYHRREPWNWDAIRHENYFGKPLETHFRDVAKMMDRFMDRPFCEENYVRPKEAAEAWLKSEIAEVKYDSKKMEVKLDVSVYSPAELNVTVSEDRLVIKGKHEQKADNHGYVSREFTREFVMPENIDADTITSTLSDEGMLIIQGRVKGAEESTERVINIEREKKED